jgi:hypothetical protein
MAALLVSMTVASNVAPTLETWPFAKKPLKRTHHARKRRAVTRNNISAPIPRE